jgi:hypothetical protein
MGVSEIAVVLGLWHMSMNWRFFDEIQVDGIFFCIMYETNDC